MSGFYIKNQGLMGGVGSNRYDNLQLIGSGGGGLYDFSSFTFTNGTQTGRFGPSLQNLLSAYDTNENPWLEDTEFFSTSDGIQLWTVPANGVYRIEAFGASGGLNNAYNESAGFGARMRGDFTLTAGEVIKILVGQLGESLNNTCSSASGGGGTFVVKYTESTHTNDDILVIAGGGGGVGTTVGFTAGIGGTTDQAGTASNGGEVSGGSGGSGGARPPATPCAITWVSGSGGGFFTNGGGPGGEPGLTNTGGGFAFVEGGNGGDPNVGSSSSPTQGSFGGGGRGQYGAGGGGGYSGGGGGAGTSCTCSAWRGGGGGGSFNSGSNQDNQSNENNGHGKVIITRL